ncbi:MAG: ABC transporter substrate-binding protein [Lachnospiraceae bacterium]|jgi:multiple sugar transport system substrate-binding protein
MKKIIAIGLAAAMVLSCAPVYAEGTTEADKEYTNNVNDPDYEWPDYSGETLRIMWWGSDTRHQITQQVLDLYTEKTGLEFEPEYMDGGSYFTSFTAKMAANDLPDVFQMGNNWLTYYDTIQPLNEYIESGVIDTADIPETLLNVTKNFANGDITGISNGTNTRCFAYNPAIFDEVGLEYPDYYWTWEEFAADARAITEYTGNPAITTLEYNNLVFSVVTQWKEGYNFFNMDGTGFAFNGDTEPIAYILDLLNTLQQEGVIADFGIQNEIGSNVEADWIASGDAAMMMIASNQFLALSNVAAENGITLNLTTIPRVSADGQSGMSIRSSQELCISATSEKKDIAANFLNFWVNSIEANEILNCERGVSINTAVLADLQANSELTDETTSKVYQLIADVSAMPDIANTSMAEPAATEEITDVLKKTYIQGLANGEFASAQECADAFWAEVQEIWAKFEAESETEAETE